MVMQGFEKSLNHFHAKMFTVLTRQNTMRIRSSELYEHRMSYGFKFLYFSINS